MADFTHTQGRYLAFIHAYTSLHGCPPAESEIAAAMCVSPPSVNQMMRSLEKKGLVLRQPGQPRAIQILVAEDEIPPWGNRKPTRSRAHPADQPGTMIAASSSPRRTCTFCRFTCKADLSARSLPTNNAAATLKSAATRRLKTCTMPSSRPTIAGNGIRTSSSSASAPLIPPDPTTAFQILDNSEMRSADARTARLDDLDLNPGRVFGYWFDFGDDWYHQVQVDRIEQAIRTVTYPRVIKRVGMSPPQHHGE